MPLEFVNGLPITSLVNSDSVVILNNGSKWPTVIVPERKKWMEHTQKYWQKSSKLSKE